MYLLQTDVEVALKTRNSLIVPSSMSNITNLLLTNAFARSSMSQQQVLVSTNHGIKNQEPY